MSPTEKFGELSHTGADSEGNLPMARKNRWGIEEDDEDEAASPPPEPCWLCERPLGEAVEYHHPVPKSRGGRGKVSLHPICHQAIHANFTNAQLGRMGEDVEAIRENEAMAKFLQWIADKPSDFYVPTAKPGRR